ncbi:MAG: NUDIX domain-containing protein [Bacteroidia bacterium]|nr:NUDIX domain-containing protein [Bacteroidia bacterium]
MNIIIYYLDKKIQIQESKQISDNQLFKNLEDIKTAEIKEQFEDFINDTNKQILNFKCKNIEKGLEQFKKAFKYIIAAGGLIEKDNHWLFIYRLKKWDLPKGKLDMGESPKEAAIRECEEECGITQLTIKRELNPTYHIYPHKKYFALKKTYWYLMSTLHTSTLIPQLEENIEKVEWFNILQIKEQVINNTYPAILDVISEITE